MLLKVSRGPKYVILGDNRLDSRYPREWALPPPSLHPECSVAFLLRKYAAGALAAAAAGAARAALLEDSDG